MNSITQKILPALVAVLGLMPAGPVAAQTFTILHSFSVFAPDGRNPEVGLVLAGNTLYGTTAAGGDSAYGTVFAVKTDGSGFTNLHSFGPGGDGRTPRAGLMLAGGTLYGTASAGGSSSAGSLFRINTNGTGFTNFYSFTGSSGGINPYGGLVLSGDTLYGTTRNTYGSVFAVNTNGSGFTNLHSFTATSSGTNTDGASPMASLVLLGNTLLGVTSVGGFYTRGTVFAISTNGTGFTNLHNFTYSDGANPTAEMIASGSTLYGTTTIGGGSGEGAVFALSTNGSGFTNLHAFSPGAGGYNPAGGLLLSGSTLYGTASAGGTGANGTIFRLNTDGTGYTNLYNFTLSSSDGSTPYASLVLSANTLFSTTRLGGSSNYGTVFSLSLPLPKLAIVRSGANVILTWANAAFGLQSAPAVTGTFTNISAATSPYTNAITGGQQFFRLIAN